MNFIKTGFDFIDAQNGGIEKGKEYFILGNTACGMSSLALTIANNLSGQRQVLLLSDIRDYEWVENC